MLRPNWVKQSGWGRGIMFSDDHNNNANYNTFPPFHLKEFKFETIENQLFKCDLNRKVGVFYEVDKFSSVINRQDFVPL